MSAEINALTHAIQANTEMTKRVHEAMYGDVRSETGISSRVWVLEQSQRKRDKWYWLIGAIAVGLLIKTIVAGIF